MHIWRDCLQHVLPVGRRMCVCVCLCVHPSSEIEYFFYIRLGSEIDYFATVGPSSEIDYFSTKISSEIEYPSTK